MIMKWVYYKLAKVNLNIPNMDEVTLYLVK